MSSGKPLQNFRSELALLLQNDIARLRIHQVPSDHLTEQQLADLLGLFIFNDPQLFLVVALQLHVIFALDTLGAFILIQAFAGEDLHIDDDAFHAGRHREGRILDVPGLLTENCAQQFLFRR
jgi:hypothetical protein